MSEKPKKRAKFRLDMIIKEIVELGEINGSGSFRFRFVAIPDPRVWERRTVNGQSGYWHKIDHMFLSDEELRKAAPTIKGKPIYVENIGMKGKDEYLKKSKSRIEQE